MFILTRHPHFNRSKVLLVVYIFLFSSNNKRRRKTTHTHTPQLGSFCCSCFRIVDETLVKTRSKVIHENLILIGPSSMLGLTYSPFKSNWFLSHFVGRQILYCSEKVRQSGCLSPDFSKTCVKWRRGNVCTHTHTKVGFCLIRIDPTTEDHLIYHPVNSPPPTPLLYLVYTFSDMVNYWRWWWWTMTQGEKEQQLTSRRV